MENPQEDRLERPTGEKEDPPPFFGTWNRLYVSVVLYTLALIVALYAVTIILNR